MKKSILNLGKALSMAEQKIIIGGEGGGQCVEWCSDGSCLCWSKFPFCTVETDECPL